jgi:hypothetical protein
MTGGWHRRVMRFSSRLRLSALRPGDLRCFPRAGPLPTLGPTRPGGARRLASGHGGRGAPTAPMLVFPRNSHWRCLSMLDFSTLRSRPRSAPCTLHPNRLPIRSSRSRARRDRRAGAEGGGGLRHYPVDHHNLEDGLHFSVVHYGTDLGT